jgi:hypothetical protein
MNAPSNGRTLLPEWLIHWMVPALIGVVMLLADRRITALEVRMDARDSREQAAAVQYATDNLSHLEAERQTLHDLRVICGNKNLNVPCPTE